MQNVALTGAVQEAVSSSQSERDQKESATAPKFGELYNQIQAKYGEKPQKPREIKKTLGKDDFMRIMITQMKNQDPTNPFKAEQMATEIAQFTSVEQLHNVNENLNKLAHQNRPLEQMTMTNLIGKTVTIDRQRFPHLDGQTESLSFNLKKNAGSVQVAIMSQEGEPILEKDLGSQKSGEVTFNWDGLKSNTLPAKSGNYFYRVEAKDEKGVPIQIDSQSQGKVIGVSFEGTDPVFLVGDAKHQDKITIKNIIRIDAEPEAKPVIVSAPAPNSVAASVLESPAVAHESTPENSSNFFTFKKGVGSMNTEPPPMIVEKGFPNGLKDPDEFPAKNQKGGEIE